MKPGQVKIEDGIELTLILMKCAERVPAKNGNIYYHLPCWFEEVGPGELVLHLKNPEDLTEFITKAGLGGDNPQITKPEI